MEEEELKVTWAVNLSKSFSRHKTFNGQVFKDTDKLNGKEQTAEAYTTLFTYAADGDEHHHYKEQLRTGKMSAVASKEQQTTTMSFLV